MKEGSKKLGFIFDKVNDFTLFVMFGEVLVKLKKILSMKNKISAQRRNSDVCDALSLVNRRKKSTETQLDQQYPTNQGTAASGPTCKKRTLHL